MMRKLFILLTALLCLAVLSASAEAPTQVTYKGLTVSADVTYVDLGDIVVNDYNELMSFLDQLPNLEKFDMFTTRIYKENIEKLAARYPNVRFGWTMIIANKDHKHKIRTDATAFSTLHNNKSKTHVSSDFEILKYCPDLLALDFGHNSVKDLSFLNDLPQLKVLIIACNKVEDISPLANLTNLEYLEIFKNNITDISPLANLTNLIDLNICFNRVNDWSPLLGLKQLDRLWLYNSNNYSANSPVPKDVVNQIKQALPNTYVDSTHYSTTGGWREHDRYFIINNMFQSGTYIPFTAPEASSAN